MKNVLALELFDPMNMSEWKILLLSYTGKYGGDKILYIKKEGLESISDKLNPFWRDILLNLSEMLSPKDEEENSIINILSQPIWLNFNIKRNGNFVIIDKYCYNGVFFINDIFSEDKQFLLYQELQNKCMISTNFLEYYGIVGAVPKGWRKLISEYGKLHDIKNDIVDRLKCDKKD